MVTPKYDYKPAIKMAKDGFNTKQISEKLRIPRISLRCYFHYHGIEYNNCSSGNVFKYDYTEAIKLAGEGMLIGAISRKTKIPKTSLTNHFGRYNIEYHVIDQSICQESYRKAVHLAGQDIQVHKISEMTGISKTYLTRLFTINKIHYKRVYQTTPKIDYRRAVKLAFNHHTIDSIHKRTGINKDTLRIHFNKYQMPYRKRNGEIKTWKKK